MKKFKTSRFSNKRKLLVSIILLTIVNILLINIRIKDILLDIITTKIEEKTNILVKKDIVPKNVEVSKLIKIVTNTKGEIVSTDIDMDYANTIMVDIVSKIQKNINEIDKNPDEFVKYKKNVFIKIPVLINEWLPITSSLGPKIPIRIDFYEHSFGSIDLELVDYGINNALLKIYLNIEIEQKIYLPYKKKKFKKNYRMIIGAKIINGSVPSVYGGKMSLSSKIM